MSARDFLTVFGRRWLLLVMATLLGVAGGYVTSLGSDGDAQTFRATHTLTVNSDLVASVPVEGETSGPAVTAAQYAVLVDRGPVPVAAAERLGYTGDPAILASEIEVEPNDDVGTIEISHVASTPAAAARVANAFGTELVEYLTERTREAHQAEIEDAQADLDQINSRLESVEAQLQVIPPPPNAAILNARQEALVNQYRIADERFRAAANQPDTSPVQTLQRAEGLPVHSGLSLPENLMARLFVTGLIGLLVGCAIALALEGIDTRIRDREQAERAFGLPVIAEIPAMPRSYHGELVGASDQSEPLVEAYRGLATVLAFYDAQEAAGADAAPEATPEVATTGAPGPATERSAMVVVVVSPGPGEGKTATVAHEALAFADVGRDVVVLDCDFHRPRIAEIFGVDQEAGLRDALAWRQGQRLELFTHASGVRVAPAGRAVGDPARLLAHAPELIDQVRGDADVVLIDTPPIMAVSDAISLAALADNVLVVCRVGRTTRTAAERTRAVLDRVGAPMLGVVLVAVARRRSNYYGYYHDAKTTEHKPSRRERRRERKKQDDLDWEDFTVEAPPTNGVPPADDVVEAGSGSTPPSRRDKA